MATSGRQASLFGVQDWQRLYQTYREADFRAYDYETLRKSFIDYLTTYYPETYTDYIESSEFVALLDVIAFMGQSLAFRGDLNARENFIDTAERRDSVVKLANLVSYNPKRNIAGQGLVKISAVSTTENIQDINGTNLSNTTILWNDPANAFWQDQFNTVLNSAFINSQRIGRPGNSQTILGVKTDEYTVNIPAGQLPVIPYSTEVDGTLMNFELVSATSLNSTSLYELPPAPSSQFNMLYRNDKLGYGSPNTGFFFYFKQGNLQNVDFGFPERIENTLYPIDVEGINNTDTWLYQLNSDGSIQYQWSQVENIFVNANLQGTSGSKIFTVTSRANDQVTYIFGDGVFGEIPVGNYRAYVRSSNALTYSIDPSEMNGIAVNLNYISRTNRVETLTFTFSLQQVSNTALQRESLAQIKERAPARYYTQNRMVNGEDYTNFPFTLYNSIVKSAAVNRTSIGISRNQDLIDPTGKYSSTNVFGDDGALWVDTGFYNTTFATNTINIAAQFLSLTLPSLLSDFGSVQYYQRYYPRYAGEYASQQIGWKLSTIDGTQSTGYFTYSNFPVPIGTYGSQGAAKLFKGSQFKVVAPTGKYFDANHRLQTGIPNFGAGDSVYFWAGITNVVGDGYNFGEGNLPSGLGPVTLNTYVPTGALLDDTPTPAGGIIPGFDTTIGPVLIRSILALIDLQQDFALRYDNSLPADSERWSIVQPIPQTVGTTDYHVKFIHNSVDTSYLVSVRTVSYNFGSVEQVRFLFDGTQRVFDSKSGTVIADTINVLANNTNPLSGEGPTLGKNYKLNVISQKVQSDGYPNDYQVTVSSIDPTTGFTYDPDFFYHIVGNQTDTVPLASGSEISFFGIVDDTPVLLSGDYQNGGVYNSASIQSVVQVQAGVYDYASGTIFYCSEGKGSSATGLVTVDTSQWPTSIGLVFDNTTNAMTFASSWVNYARVTVADGVNSYSFIANTAASIAEVVTLSELTDLGIPAPSSATSAIIKPQFYQSVLQQGTNPPVLLLNNVTSGYYPSRGRNGVYFQYRHNSGNTTRVDPGTTNIIDLYLVTQSYYTQYQNWLKDTTGTVPMPAKPTINELQQSYSQIDDYKMISDTVILNSVDFKPLFGTKAAPALQGTIKVIKSPATTASDSQIRSSVLAALNSYFTIDKWNFGDTFYFSELSAYLHVQLGTLISSVVLVSANPNQAFGDLYEIRCAPSEIFVNGATEADIIVISALTPSALQRPYRI